MITTICDVCDKRCWFFNSVQRGTIDGRGITINWAHKQCCENEVKAGRMFKRKP